MFTKNLWNLHKITAEKKMPLAEAVSQFKADLIFKRAANCAPVLDDDFFVVNGQLWDATSSADKAAQMTEAHRIYSRQGQALADAFKAGDEDAFEAIVAAELAALAFTPYKVKVTSPAINVRKEASPNAAVVSQLRDLGGTHTIIGEATASDESVWGLLGNNTGWINLKFTEKI